MYFKTLEMIGFKSFYNKTVLHFEPGITAIVGPNGCGKSNIFDAIRWVLGEQSVKALRGSQMEDVIFNGTETKEQLGMAEVSLTFDNSQKFFPIDHPEVVITRRLFRSGESEYLINKNTVRLKDILDLLMDTGIGAESYSLIQQGKIDLILSSRPEDRRLVFDEAAGISKYKTQKKESLRRLEETEQNLLRINDIIAEVKRQISSLERQANRARRYHEIFEELKNNELKLAVILKNQLREEKESISHQLSITKSKEEELTQAISEKEKNYSQQQQELKALEEDIMQLKNQLLNFENTIERNSQRIEFNNEKIEASRLSIKNLKEQLEKTQNRLTLNQEKLLKIQKECDEFKEEISRKKDLLQNNEARLQQINLALKNSQNNISSLKSNTIELAAKISNCKNQINETNSQKQILHSRKKRLELESQKVEEEFKNAQDSLNQISSIVNTLEEKFNSLCQNIEATSNELSNKKSQKNLIREELDRLEKELLTLISQKEFLEQLKTKYENIEESMNAQVFLDKNPRQLLNGLIIKINATSLQEGINDPASPALKIKGEAKFIDLDATQIKDAILQLQTRIATTKTHLEQTENQINSLEFEISSLLENRRQEEINLADKKAQHRNIQEQFDKINSERQLMQFELADIEEEIIKCENKLKESSQELEKLENEQKQSDESITKEQAAIIQYNSEKENLLVVIAQAKTELEAMQERQASNVATLKILQDQYQQDKDSCFRIEETIEANQTKISTLEEENNKLAGEIEQTKNSILECNGRLEEKHTSYQKINALVCTFADEIEKLRFSLEETKNFTHQLLLQLKDNEFQYQNLKERMLSGYKIDIEEATYPDEPQPEIQLLRQNIEQLKQKLDSYGSVNLVAIEEYDELKKRYDFLTQQQEDLVNAKTSLLEAIQKINRNTKKIFLETFQRVREEFRNYFRLLFNGGDCEIFLLDEHDPLESGIEIVCRPPGKKLQNILLLSGGEKSLAAIALIFAIFKVKPAPFCILDEIDAALDEANVERFSRMLTEFTQNSQFIVITHNKRTIANANVMYGITMEESGISKIVSVKFSQEKEPVFARKENQPAVADPA